MWAWAMCTFAGGGRLSQEAKPQRMKLAARLDATDGTGRKLYVLDEPTTGLSL